MKNVSAHRYIGHPIKDARNLRHVLGQGQFIDDLTMPGLLYCAFVRSPYGHALIQGMEKEKAEAKTGVISVITGEDMRGKVRPQLQYSNIPLLPFKRPTFSYLALDRVRYVGEPLAAIIASDKYTAEDAAELVEVSYDPLPCVVDAEKAMEKNSVLLYPDWEDNIMAKYDFSFGDADSCFSGADNTVSKTFKVHRHGGSPIETRGVMAEYDKRSGLLTVWASSQTPHLNRRFTAQALGISENDIRVVAPDVGGGFGVKVDFYPEDVIIPFISKRMGRPIKWIETRTEHMMASNHSREITYHVRAALKQNGTILGIRSKVIGDLGASTVWPGTGLATTYIGGVWLPGAYDIKNVHCEIYCVVTNKSPRGSYRGFGQPEAVFCVERLIDIIATDLRADPAEFRLRNFVSNFPHVYPNGQVHESGDYVGMMKRALEMVDYPRWRKQQKKLEAMTKEGIRSRYIGIGLAAFPELSACSWGGFPTLAHEGMTVTIEEDGNVQVFSGGAEIGTGISTTIAQVVAETLGVEPNRIRVNIGDTQSSPFGLGLWGSRGASCFGSVAFLASEKLRDKIAKIAAHLMEANPLDIEIRDSEIFVKGYYERKINLSDIAWSTYNELQKLPDGMEPGLNATCYFNPPLITGHPNSWGRYNITGAMSSGVCAAVVEVDIETGSVKVLDYVTIHDCGKEINPATVRGQMIGACVQGISGTLNEEFLYDQEGQLLSSNFIDYLLPTAVDAFNIEKIGSMEIDPPSIPVGAKGSGETGIIGPPAALANAVEDALRHLGIEITQTPLKPESIWRLIRNRTSA